MLFHEKLKFTENKQIMLFCDNDTFLLCVTEELFRLKTDN